MAVTRRLTAIGRICKRPDRAGACRLTEGHDKRAVLRIAHRLCSSSLPTNSAFGYNHEPLRPARLGVRRPHGSLRRTEPAKRGDQKHRRRTDHRCVALSHDSLGGLAGYRPFRRKVGAHPGPISHRPQRRIEPSRWTNQRMDAWPPRSTFLNKSLMAIYFLREP